MRYSAMFAYYSKSIPKFLKKIQPFVKANRFPLGKKAVKAFNTLKSGLCKATIWVINENIPFSVRL